MLKKRLTNPSILFFYLFLGLGIMLGSCTSEDPGNGGGGENGGGDELNIEGNLPALSLDEAALKTADRVRVHSLGDVQHLNFMTATDAQSTEMGYQTHQYLYQLHPKTYEYTPVLAKQRATVTEKDGKVIMDFEIRPEAKWDNGTPITAEDIIYSLKLVFTPDVETVDRLKPYLDYIEDIVVDKDNPKKFTVYCKEPYMSVETSICTNLVIMPSYVYDPKGVMKGYKLKDLLDETKSKKFASDAKLKEYAKFFNSDQFKFDVQAGSGPYAFSKWDTNERIVLKRKENWWGDKVKEPNNPWFQAHPKEVVYTTVTDLTTAVVALKGQSLDAMKSVPNKQFVQDLAESNDFKGKYGLFTPPYFAYDYIGINTRDPRLADVNVRKAMAHAMNVKQLVKTELYGLGDQMVNIIHPLFKGRFNDKIKPYAYNLGKAKALLEEAGWKDSDGNGILDKEIDGELEELKFKIYTNNGNDRRKSSAIIFKDGLSKLGIELDIRILEWATFLDKTQKKDFDLYIGGWAASPVESDPAQIWHTDSYKDGSNYVGFGTPETDALIDNLRKTVNNAERFELYKKLQQEIHDQVPYIFLVVQKNRVVLSRKYDNIYGSGLRSGFLPNGFSPVNAVTQ